MLSKFDHIENQQPMGCEAELTAQLYKHFVMMYKSSNLGHTDLVLGSWSEFISRPKSVHVVYFGLVFIITAAFSVFPVILFLCSSKWRLFSLTIKWREPQFELMLLLQSPFIYVISQLEDLHKSFGRRWSYCQCNIMTVNRLTVQETLQDLSVFFYEDRECSRLGTEAAKTQTNSQFNIHIRIRNSVPNFSIKRTIHKSVICKIICIGKLGLVVENHINNMHFVLSYHSRRRTPINNLCLFPTYVL